MNVLCRVDSSGTIFYQRGIFRVNCIDCLDRTNVVQSAIARIVLEIQVTAQTSKNRLTAPPSEAGQPAILSSRDRSVADYS